MGPAYAQVEVSMSTNGSMVRILIKEEQQYFRRSFEDGKEEDRVHEDCMSLQWYIIL